MPITRRSLTNAWSVTPRQYLRLLQARNFPFERLSGASRTRNLEML